MVEAAPRAGTRQLAVLQKMIVELMPLERDLEIRAEGADPRVAFADPFGAELADEIRILRQPVGKYAPADPFARFEHRHAPTRVFEFIGGGESGKPGADDDAGFFSPLGENVWRRERRTDGSRAQNL